MNGEARRDGQPRFAEWCPDLVAALREPFPDSAWRDMEIPTKGGKTTSVPYIPWFHYAEKLDELVGPAGWSIGEPRWQVIGSPAQLIVAAPITILGVTKWAVATDDLERIDRKSGEIEHVEGYGGPIERAMAALLKRGCALFGLGRDDVYARKGPAGKARGPKPAQPWQRKKINRLMREREIAPNELTALQGRLGDDLTFEKAGEIIDWLSKRPVKQAGAARG